MIYGLGYSLNLGPHSKRKSMDFVVSNQPLQNTANLLSDFSHSQLNERLYKWESTNSSLYAYASPSQCYQDSTSTYIYDGLLYADGVMIHSSVEIARSTGANDQRLHRFHQALMGQTRGHSHSVEGVFCFISIKQDNSLTIYLDPLGNYPIYVWQSQGRFIASNNILLLEQLSNTKRSIYPAVENLLTGSCSERDTHLIGVRRLPPCSRLDVDHDGNLDIIETSDSNVNCTYQEAFDQFRSSLLRNLDAVFDYNKIVPDSYWICDLTGGKDSRVLLAYLMAKLSPSDIHIRTMGMLPSPDVNVSNFLVECCALKGGHFPVIGYPPDYAVRFNSFLSGGSRDSGVSMSPYLFPNLIHIRGTYGGLGGALPGTNFLAEAFQEGLSIKDGIKILKKRRSNAGALNLLTSYAIEHAASRFEAYLSDLESNGISRDDLLLERYMRTRSRTHFGLNSFIENKSRQCPELLNSYWLYLAAKALGPRASSGKIMYDLILSSPNKELAYYPMASKKWDVNCSTGLDRYLLDRVDVITYDSSFLSSRERSLNCPIRYPVPSRSSWKPLAAGINKPALTPQLSNLIAYRNISKYLFEICDSTDSVWEMFDRKKVYRELFEKSDDDFAVHGIDVNSLGIFAAAMAWTFKLEKVIPRQEIVSFDVN